jgi:hypothetical protein
MSASGLDAREWAKNHFPHPNPYFPDPPRDANQRRLVFWGTLVVLGLASGIAAVVFFATREKPSKHWVALFPLFFGPIGATWAWTMFQRSFALRPWVYGRIVPAVVRQAPSIPLPDSNWLRVALIGPTIGRLIARDMRRSRAIYNTAVVDYVDGGSAKRAQFLTEGWWEYFPINSVVWILLTKRGACPLQFCAPQEVAHQEVPGQANKWLLDSLASLPPLPPPMPPGQNYW